MIVYGDPTVRAKISEIVAALRNPRDGVRSQLIVAGQLEQALEDQGHPAAALARQITDRCAEAYVNASKPTSSALLTKLPLDQELVVKVPEGYQCYGLYPQQYVDACSRLPCEMHRCTVIGIRSIGTSLSAVVAATLEDRRVQVERRTVRPSGDPYRRAIDPADLGEVEKSAWLVVVDEGPGQSGSSFASVAKAGYDLGIPYDRIILLTGHSGEPGGAATFKTRSIWSQVKRCSVEEPSDVLEALIMETSRLLDAFPSRGLIASTDAWIGTANAPVYQPFESQKFQTSFDGESLMWVFYGLDSLGAGAGLAQQQLAERARLGWSISPAAPPAHGYIPFFYNSRRLVSTAYVATEEVAEYLLAVAAPGAADDADQERLAHMLFWNVHKTLGTEAAQKVRCITPATTPATEFVYPDGRMMLYNWRRDSSGKLMKLDGVGHQQDHTVIGSQSILWDIAGAVVELSADEEELLLRMNLAPFTEYMPFYKAAYLAFWMGMARMSADILGVEDHRTPALEQAYERYRDALAAALTDT
jgi:hypothetical protein